MMWKIDTEISFHVSWFICLLTESYPQLISTAKRGQQEGEGGEISPGGTLRGRQNHVSSSTGKYGIGLNIVKLTLFVKNFGFGAIFDFL